MSLLGLASVPPHSELPVLPSPSPQLPSPCSPTLAVPIPFAMPYSIAIQTQPNLAVARHILSMHSNQCPMGRPLGRAPGHLRGSLSPVNVICDSHLAVLFAVPNRLFIRSGPYAQRPTSAVSAVPFYLSKFRNYAYDIKAHNNLAAFNVPEPHASHSSTCTISCSTKAAAHRHPP